MKSGKFIVSDMLVRRGKKDHYVSEAILRSNDKDYIIYSGSVFEYTLTPSLTSDKVSGRPELYLPKFYDENDTEINYSNLIIYLKDGNITNNLDTLVSDIEKIKVNYSRRTRRITAPKNIVSLLRLSTKDLTSMYKMFSGCSHLETVNASDWIMTNIKSLRYTFYGCKMLKTITGLSGWNTSNVEDMANMFSQCTLLESVTLPNWNIGNVNNTSGMFSFCTALKTVDLSNWDTSNLISCDEMFSNCINLEMVNLSNWDTENITDAADMFLSVPNLGIFGWGYDGINYSKWELDETESGYGYTFPWNMEYTLQYTVSQNDPASQAIPQFYGLKDGVEPDRIFRLVLSDGSYSKDIDSRNLGIERVEFLYDENTVTKISFADTAHIMKIEKMVVNELWTDLSRVFYNCGNLFEVNTSGWNTSNVTNMSEMFRGCSNLDSLDVTNLDTCKVTNMSGMFREAVVMEPFGNYTVDLSTWDVRNVTDMSYMFYDSGFDELDFSSWNTDKLTNTEYMFYLSDSLKKINLTDWNTSKVTNMRGMFSRCVEIEEIIGLADWDVSSVTNMEYMFGGSHLTNINNLADWDVSSVTNMKDMFGWNDFITVNLPNWNTKSVTNMAFMFSNCESLRTINILNWDTSNVTNMSFMFTYCSRLQSINIPDWNTRNLTDMEAMFWSCRELKSVNLSNWDTRNVTKMAELFGDCKQLQSINLSNWDTRNVTENKGGIFRNVPEIKNAKWGYNGINYTNFNFDEKDVDYGYTFPWNKTFHNLVYYTNIRNTETASILEYFPKNFSRPSSDISNLSYMIDYDLLYILTLKDGTISGDVTTQTSAVSRVDVLYEDEYPYRTLTFRNNGLVEYIYDLKITNEWDSLYRMFYNCYSLKGVDMTGWDTSNVTSTSYMFNGCQSIKSIDLTSWNVSNITDVDYMFNGCSSLTTLDLSTWDTSQILESSSMLAGVPRTVDFNYDLNNYRNWSLLESDVNFDGIFPWNLERAVYNISRNSTSLTADTHFAEITGSKYPQHYIVTTLNDKNVNENNDCSNIALSSVKYITALYAPDVTHISFVDLTYLESVDYLAIPEGVTDLSGLFHSCTNLKYVNFKNCNTSNVTNMFGLFYGCSSLQSVDFSSFVTENVTRMDYMFYNCSNLKTITGINNFEVINVTDMKYMFKDCKSLKSLILSNWYTAKVTNMDYMFSNCTGLESIDISSFNTTNVTNKVNYMFENISYLIDWNYTGYNYRNFNLSETKTCYQKPGKFPWNVTSFKNLSYTIASNSSNESVRTHIIKGLSYGEYTFILTDNTTTTDFNTPLKNVAEVRVSYDAYAVNFNFKGNNLMNGITGFAVNSNWTSMESLFEECRSLPALDSTSWNTSSVTSMLRTFYNCKNMASVDIDVWNLNKVQNLGYMFYGCSSLKTIDMGGKHAGENPNDYRCKRVTNTQSMFYGCSSLVSVDLSYCSLGGVDYMDSMFRDCVKLSSVKFYKNMYSAIVDFRYMFYNCTSLTTFVSWVNISNSSPIAADYMFYGCTKADTLNLSLFDFSDATSYSGMFTNVPSSATIDMGSMAQGMNETTTGFSGTFK